MQFKHVISIIVIFAFFLSKLQVLALDSDRKPIYDREFTGTLEKRVDKNEELIYFVIKLDPPVNFHNRIVKEAQISILDIPKLREAFLRNGSKIWVKGSMRFSEADKFLDVSITGDEIKFVD